MKVFLANLIPLIDPGSHKRIISRDLAWVCPAGVWDELVEKEDFEPTEKMNAEFKYLNEGLIIPIYGSDVVRIIKWGKQFLKEIKGES